VPDPFPRKVHVGRASIYRALEVPFEIAEHDVVLRGLCERCAN
jgi:Fe2+ or Zn2+ uptake regulation protein